MAANLEHLTDDQKISLLEQAATILVSPEEAVAQVAKAADILVTPPEQPSEIVRRAAATTLSVAVVAGVGSTLLESTPANASIPVSASRFSSVESAAPAHPHDGRARATEHKGKDLTTTEHEVASGETVWGDAKAVVDEGIGHSVRGEVQEIEAINDMHHPRTELEAGMTIKLPALPHQRGEIRNYKVQSGDTLNGLAEEWHVDLHKLLAINPQFRNDPNLIYPGQEVHEPAKHHHEAKPKHQFKDETVEPGDTFDGMLEEVHTSPTQENVDISARASGVKDADRIFPGEHVRVLLTKHANQHSTDRKHAPKPDPKQRPTHEIQRHGETPQPNRHKPNHDPKYRGSVHEQRKHLEHLKLDIEGYHGNAWTKHELHEIQRLLPFYMKAAEKHHIPWQMLPALHMREHGLGISNPSNGQGVYQFYSGGRDYAPGPISMHEFESQTMHAAAELAHNYAPRTDGTVPGHLSFNKGNLKKIAATFYAYNGMAYGQQAKEIGYHSPEDAFQGSPYVMNLASHAQDSSTNPGWGQIIYDDGEMAPANHAPGAWLLFRDLVNITPGAEHINSADLDDNSKVKTAPPVEAPAPQPSQGETVNGNVGQQLADAMLKLEKQWQDNGYYAPGGQSGPSMFITHQGDPSGAWCAYAASWIAKSVGVPMPSNIYNGRVADIYKAAEQNDAGWSAHDVSDGSRPQIGDFPIHAYDGSTPNHINMVTAIKGNRMQLTGGDQTNPRIGHWDTIYDSTVSSYWVDIPTATNPSDSIISYVRAPAPTPPVETPPATETMPQPPTTETPSAPASPQPTDPTAEAPSSPPAYGPAHPANGVARY